MFIRSMPPLDVPDASVLGVYREGCEIHFMMTDAHKIERYIDEQAAINRLVEVLKQLNKPN